MRSVTRVGLWGASLQVLTLLAVLTDGANKRDQTSTGQVSQLIKRLLNSKIYNSRIRPSADSGNPLLVYVNLHVTEIYHISEVDMEFSMTFFLRQRWLDERLTYHKYNKSITLNYNQFGQIWSPDLFIRNLKAGHLHQITVPNRLIRLYPDGTLLFSQRISVTLACDMYLERYPMDNQTCGINFGSYAYTTDDMILKWDNTIDHPVAVKKTISFPKFEYKGVKVFDCVVGYASTGQYPCIEAFFMLSRRIRSYILYVYLPSLLVVVLSWVSFWIDLDAVPARISLGILTILTITTQSVGLNRNLPSVSFTKAIDVWLASCLVFVFAAFLEYSVVNVLARRQKLGRKRGNNYPKDQQQAQHDKEPKDMICINTSNNQGTYQEEHIVLQPSPTDMRHRSNGMNSGSISAASGCSHQSAVAIAGAHHHGKHKNRKRKKRPNHALRVDIVSRICFPFLFIIFNAIYWPFYWFSDK